MTLFRMTQSFLTNAFVDYLRKQKWCILYEDYVNGRRSGRGAQGAVNDCFKMVFDQFPDIVAVYESKMLVVEVDVTYKRKYLKKLISFKEKEDTFLTCVNNRLGLKLTTLDSGMVFERKPDTSATKELIGIQLWVYDKRANGFISYRTNNTTFYKGL